MLRQGRRGRRGAGRDLALASISIRLGGRGPLVLPKAIAPEPIAVTPLRLEDAHRHLGGRGVHMTHDHDLTLERTVDEASIRLVSADDGVVLEIAAGWRPRPGGWFYSEEREEGVWVSGDPGGRRAGRGPRRRRALPARRGPGRFGPGPRGTEREAGTAQR
ncbi:hypothetical protein GCM10009678_70030 [Actinomadura kijaniata]|uniref:Uncharacterized protein n=1 Tax=Actinomadura namibiensis TaxID=182080 RepID=A0A7W3QNL9_ACTNM|nr:hypothetical protein [Actinomadura namibiensis]MBA8953696.1 hypothetical protein [Actinomadura namibiensis]